VVRINSENMSTSLLFVPIHKKITILHSDHKVPAKVEDHSYFTLQSMIDQPLAVSSLFCLLTTGAILEMQMYICQSQRSL